MSFSSDLTLEYYKQNADSFVNGTINADMSKVRQRFAKCLPAKGTILDFGCGSGRDAKAFSEAGFSVVALDGSQELCDMAFEVLEQPVICCKFQDYRAIAKYDGIWACASLLHLGFGEMGSVLQELVDSLKPEGALYLSFKYGTYSGERNGRWFTDMTEEQLDDLMDQFQQLSLIDQWLTEDVRQNRNEKWINSIYKKI